MAKAHQNAGRKPGQGKRKGKNNIPTTPIVVEVDEESQIDVPIPYQYNKYFHNNESFQVEFILDHEKVKQCAGCKNMFCRVDVHAPYDIIILHQERYEYPVDGTYKVSQSRTRKVFYCLNVECIKPRHPYFWKGRVLVRDEIRERLKATHKGFIRERVHMDLE